MIFKMKVPWCNLCHNCFIASENGHLECLKYLHTNGLFWNETAFSISAQHGHLECMKYLHANGCPWNSEACRSASYYGQLECLKYLHEHGCPWDRWSFINAAENGHLECLKYLHEHECPGDKLVFLSAAQRGLLECLKYLHDSGWDATPENLKKFPFDQRSWIFALYNEHFDCVKYLYRRRYPKYENYYDKIKHLILEDNLKILSSYVIRRIFLRSYIHRFRERYYAFNGPGYHRAKDRFCQPDS
jgi:hypothetical protein